VFVNSIEIQGASQNLMISMMPYLEMIQNVYVL
jgi:hypothetical protein